MNRIRKRAIYKSMKYHAINLMNEWYNNEHTQACFGVSVIPLKREIKVCDTLSHYAHIAERALGESYNEEEWLNHLYNFY